MIPLFLEFESHRKLQLPHAGPAFKSGDLPVGSSICASFVQVGAVHTSIGAIVSAEGVHRVIEYVEGIHPKLQVEPGGHNFWRTGSVL